VRRSAAPGRLPPILRSHADLAAFDRDVAGRRIEAVGRRGKVVLITLSDGAAITIHLKMTGQLFVVPAATPADRHVHVVLALADGRELRFRDIRKFGRMGLWPVDPATGRAHDPEAGGELFAAFGPEPLEATFTLAAFRARLRARRGRLKPLLPDQGFVAGIGNIYADGSLACALQRRASARRSARPMSGALFAGEIPAVLAKPWSGGDPSSTTTPPRGGRVDAERLEAYQRTGERATCRRPIRRIVVCVGRALLQLVPAPAGADRPGAAAVWPPVGRPRPWGGVVGAARGGGASA